MNPQNNSFVLKPDGKIYWVKDMPEKPDYCRNFSDKYPCDANGCEQAIKDGYCLCYEKMEFYEAIPMKAGDTRVIVNGKPLSVDFRIISETLYQKLTRK
jgi:hypothetical protein